ncbi:bifunctional YncE family protein/alkaline phosphatase family protein [Fibrella sp. HMF5335]|uniref:Bifunctional YncE family protein/alkaline phosphatase family protein n=1 Tax=Fibrella rubiginis TaxID=2817060 RepID=A0A939GAW5_9BACT|nr:bifunctional YncE family protein/alkaline phosphatase family protein [Fibrella rubiginis]MBO0935509.1 bifunctional YncE family protein/alkaline phosphatase family protein [Fibrella rubiginis]
MRNILPCFLLFIASLSWAQSRVDVKKLDAGLESRRVLLPNGWSLTPAGRSLEVGDLPLNIAVSASGLLMAVTNNGQGTQSIQLIDPKRETVLHSVEIPRSFYGLKFSGDGKMLYASGGNSNQILCYAITNQQLVLTDSLRLGDPWPTKISPVGIEVDDARHLLYVVTKESNSLYVVDLLTKAIVHQEKLGHECYTCVLSPNRKELYISLWGGKKVAIFDTQARRLTTTIPVSYNPNELVINKKGTLIYVANAGDNSVSVIDVKARKVIEVLDAALYPNSPVGSMTNGLALAKDERTLYIANADNNCLAVFDVTVPGKSASKGFIPVGWFPTSVRVVDKRMFVTNGKGFTSFANPLGPQPISREVRSETHVGEAQRPNSRLQYIGALMKGTMSIIDEPTETTLALYAKKVYANTPYNKTKELTADGEPGNPIPTKVGAPSPIRYVFYVLKENRTYDQVFGDIKEGNGDSTLCLFGEKYTPNQHKLAREFVLLDNFYVDAEVSADGHNWSMAAHANDYLEKTWVAGYSRRGGVTEGMGRRAIANDKDGYIWDFCQRKGVSYRSYGVFVDKDKGNIPALDAAHVCRNFTTFYVNKTKDTTRVNQWQRDFDSLLVVNAVPRFSTIRLGNDHTHGLAVGQMTPYACVADNDLAVGMLVEHISKSKIWNESAIFILEDDAQNGPDHVDAHRSNALVIGPYVKRRSVDHTMYSTSGMLRTMELILGLPPMSQYDAGATPLFRSFTSTPDASPYRSVPSNINLDALNTAHTPSAKKSESLDFSDADRIDDNLFNEILWKGLRGEAALVPAPRRGAFVRIMNKERDDD